MLVSFIPVLFIIALSHQQLLTTSLFYPSVIHHSISSRIVVHHSSLSSHIVQKNLPPFSPMCLLYFFSRGYGNQQHSLDEYSSSDVATLYCISILLHGWRCWWDPLGCHHEICQINQEQFDTIAWTCSLGRRYKQAHYLSDLDVLGSSNKKRKMVKYNCERAYKCVMSDWLGEVSWFPGKHFERAFQLKRHLVVERKVSPSSLMQDKNGHIQSWKSLQMCDEQLVRRGILVSWQAFWTYTSTQEASGRGEKGITLLPDAR